MSVFNRSSRRLKLLAGASIAAAFLALGGAAEAATCPGDYCSGTYTDITYPSVSYLFLTAAHDLNVTTGGIYVSSQSGAYTGLYSGGPTSSSGIQINNASGPGIEFDNPTGTIDVGLFRDDPANGPLSITGTTAGVRLNGNGWFWTDPAFSEPQENGSITATAGAGIHATIASWMDIRLASSVTGATGAIIADGAGSLFLQNRTPGFLDGALLLHNTGGVTFQNEGMWRASGNNVLGDGAADTFTNSGTIVVGGADEGAATLSISGAETWNNSGLILFGANADLTGSDGVANDRLVATPTTFNASGASRLVMDVAFNGSGQANCQAAVDADCLDLRGSTVTGSSEIVVNNLGGPGSLEPIVLVDVAGGTSAASNFTLSTDSPGYLNVGSGLIRAALFDYGLSYDAQSQHFMLVPTANAGAMGLAKTGAMADAIWEATTGHWQTRQADLRDSVTELGGGRHPGFWIKALGNDVERSSVMFRDFGGGKSLTYDSGYNQKTHGFVGGLDLLNVQGDGYAWALGVNAGHVTSDADYKVTASKTRFEGNTYGVYASYLAGPLFLDGIVNVNDLDMDLGFGGAGSSKSNVKTTGAQAEGGYRIFVNEGSAWLEPIATLAYIKRDFDAAKIGNGLTADLGSGSVFKGALGLRLGGKMDLSAATVGLAITGRVWDEFRGDHDVVLTSPGQPQLMLADVQPKTLGDVGVTLNVMSKSRRVSGFADYGFKFREGYSDSTASLGVRVNF